MICLIIHSPQITPKYITKQILEDDNFVNKNGTLTLKGELIKHISITLYEVLLSFLLSSFLGFLVAIPVGMLDGIVSFSLKPYMDYVVGNKSLEFTLFNHDFVISSIQMARFKRSLDFKTPFPLYLS